MSGLSEQDIHELERLLDVLHNRTYYDVFGLALDFEKGDLKTAYYELSRRFHPDRFYRTDLEGREAMLEEVFAGINEAYRVLGSTTDRQRHDREMRDKKRPLPKTLAARREAAQAAVDALDALSKPDAHGHVVQWAKIKRAAPASAPTPAASKPTPAEPKKPVSPAVERLRAQLIERVKKARAHFKEGEQHADAGAWLKASSAFYLATQFDPANEEYKRRFVEADRRSKDAQILAAMDKGRKAESFRGMKEAEHHYEQATLLDPPNGEPYFHLARMKLANEDDKRGALNLLRKAVEKDPRNIEFQMLLGQIYEQLDLKRNANRCYAAVLEVKSGHAEAKEGLKRTRG